MTHRCNSHSLARSYLQKPQNIHGQSNLQHLEQYRNTTSHNSRRLDPSFLSEPHSSITSVPLTSTSKKVFATFVIVSALLNEFQPLMVARPALLQKPRHSSTPTKPDFTPPSNSISVNTAEPSHSRLHQWIEAGSSALGAVALGPIGGLLFAPKGASALEVPSFAERAERASEAWNEAINAPSGQPLLYGKLDAAAEGFEKAAIAAEQFQKEHPVLSEFTMSATMVAAKGLTCAAQAAPAGAALGAMVGAPLGGVPGAILGAADGALYMAGRGFLVCAQAAIAQDALGRGLHSLAGKEIDSSLHGAIDIMTPFFEKVDTRLKETGRGRMFSTGLMFGLGALTDIKLGTSGMLKAVHGGPVNWSTAMDVFVRGGLLTAMEAAEVLATAGEHGLPVAIQDTIFQRAINLGSQALANPGKTTFSLDPKYDLGQAGNYFAQTGTKEIVRNQLTQALSKAEEKKVNIVASSAQFLVDKGIITNWKLGALLKDPKQKVDSQEFQKIINEFEKNNDFQQARYNVENFAGIAANVARLYGNTHLATQIQTMAKASMDIVEAFRDIQSSFESIGSGAAAGFAAGGPYGALIGALMNMAVVFFAKEKEQADPAVTAINQWGQFICEKMDKRFQEVHHSIALVGMQIINSMDAWGYHIDQELRETMFAIRNVGKQVNVLQFNLETFEKEILVHQHLIETDLKAIISKDLRKTWSILADVLNGIRTFSDPNMKDEKLMDHAEVLVAALRGQEPPLTSFNGYNINSFSPEIMSQILTTGQGENFIGYVMHFLQSLGMTLPNGIQPQDIPNPVMFQYALQMLLPLIKEMQKQQIPFDPECRLIDKIIAKAKLLLDIAEFMRSKEVLDKVVTYYQAGVEGLFTLEAQALEGTNQELSTKLGNKVSLMDSLVTMLNSMVNRKIRKTTVLPGSPNSGYIASWGYNPSELHPLEFYRSPAAQEVLKKTETTLFLAEGLELGEIEYHWSPSYCSINIMSIQADFMCKDGTRLFCGRLNIETSKEAALAALGVGRNCDLTSVIEPYSRYTWETGHTQYNFHSACTAEDPTVEDFALYPRINSDIVRRRKDFATSLFASPAYLLGRKKLESSLQVMRVLSYLLGMKKSDFQNMETSLYTQADLDRYLQSYLDIGAGQGWSTIIGRPATEKTYYSSFATYAIPNRIPKTLAENPLFGPIENLRNQLVLFKQVHKKFVKEKAKTPPPISETTSPQESLSLRQQVELLREELLRRDEEHARELKAINDNLAALLGKQKG
ncbi:MAG: hypothetical protein WCP39_01935 [Chlamydiota bacterium]